MCRSGNRAIFRRIACARGRPHDQCPLRRGGRPPVARAIDPQQRGRAPTVDAGHARKLAGVERPGRRQLREQARRRRRRSPPRRRSPGPRRRSGGASRGGRRRRAPPASRPGSRPAGRPAPRSPAPAARAAATRGPTAVQSAAPAGAGAARRATTRRDGGRACGGLRAAGRPSPRRAGSGVGPHRGGLRLGPVARSGLHPSPIPPRESCSQGFSSRPSRAPAGSGPSSRSPCSLASIKARRQSSESRPRACPGAPGPVQVPAPPSRARAGVGLRGPGCTVRASSARSIASSIRPRRQLHGSARA